MRAIVTKQNADGSYDEVGMNNRTIIGPYKRYGTINKYARLYANGKMYRVELYADRIDGKPFDVYVGC